MWSYRATGLPLFKSLVLSHEHTRQHQYQEGNAGLNMILSVRTYVSIFLA